MKCEQQEGGEERRQQRKKDSTYPANSSQCLYVLQHILVVPRILSRKYLCHNSWIQVLFRWIGTSETCSQLEQKLIQLANNATSHPQTSIISATMLMLMLNAVIFPPLPRASGSS